MASKSFSDKKVATQRRSANVKEETEELTEEGQRILECFVIERLQQDGVEYVPALSAMHPTVRAVAKSSPSEPTEAEKKIAHYLRIIGDSLDRDENLQELIETIPSGAPKETFLRVARAIFHDGIFNWGRIAALFYFAYRLIRKSLDRITVVRNIIDWTTTLIAEYVTPWIAQHGGWDATISEVVEPSRQWITFALVSLPLIISTAIRVLRYFQSK